MRRSWWDWRSWLPCMGCLRSELVTAMTINTYNQDLNEMNGKKPRIISRDALINKNLPSSSCVLLYGRFGGPRCLRHCWRRSLFSRRWQLQTHTICNPTSSGDIRSIQLWIIANITSSKTASKDNHYCHYNGRFHGATIEQ